MECDKVKELLPFLDGDSLDPGEAKAVRNHLERCETCRRVYREQNDMLSRVRTAFLQSEPEYSPEFLKAVKTKIRRKKENRILYRWAFSAAAVVVIALGLTVYSHFSGIEPVSSTGETVFEDSTEDFDNYVASQYLDSLELSAFFSESYTTEEHNLLQSFISTHYFDITPEDIIDTLGDDEIEMVLASF